MTVLQKIVDSRELVGQLPESVSPGDARLSRALGCRV